MSAAALSPAADGKAGTVRKARKDELAEVSFRDVTAR
jgi:hypothetical protein